MTTESSIGDGILEVLAALPDSVRAHLNEPLTPDEAAELELVTGRPVMARASGEDCERWCRGRGFRQRGSTFRPLTTDRVTSVAEMLSGLSYDYCRCAAGVSAQAEHVRLRTERDTRLAQQAADRIWAEADLPPRLRRYSLESYLLLPGSSSALVAKLRRWRATRASLLLYGTPGACKTGLGASLLSEALSAGRSGLYVVAPDLLDRIRLTYRRKEDGQPDQTDVIDSLVGVDLLLVDDLGKSQSGEPLSGWAKEQLFKLFNRRENYERRTIVTTNLTLDQLEAYVETPTFDRIRGGAVDEETGESFVIELSGESRRGSVRQ